MFRNIAIALVAASVLAAPVMAQNTNTLSGGSKATQAAPAPSSETPEKADKSAEKSAESTTSTEKSATKHHRVARHHHHGAKAAKYGKSRTSMALYGKHHGPKTEKYAKSESRRTGHGRISSRHTYGRAGKHMMHSPSKPTSSPSVD
jgi:hypothetical protein